MTRAAFFMLLLMSATAFAQEATPPQTRRLNVTIYYPGPNAMLTSAPTSVLLDNILEKEIKSVLELMLSQSYKYVEAIPKSTKIETVFIDGQKNVYLDFNEDISAKHPGGITLETASVGSICKTVFANFDVESIRFLQKGKELKTLAGHVDLESKMTRVQCDWLTKYR